jgi:hypothetical protein
LNQQEVHPQYSRSVILLTITKIHESVSRNGKIPKSIAMSNHDFSEQSSSWCKTQSAKNFAKADIISEAATNQ